jgi:hypothetical protein
MRKREREREAEREREREREREQAQLSLCNLPSELPRQQFLSPSAWIQLVPTWDSTVSTRA